MVVNQKYSVIDRGISRLFGADSGSEYGLLGNWLNKLARSPGASITRLMERADLEVILKAIRAGGNAVLQRNELDTDPYAMRLLVAHDVKYAKHVKGPLLNDTAFLLSVVGSYPEILQNVLPNTTEQETIEFLRSVEWEWQQKHPASFEFAIVLDNVQIGAISISLGEIAKQGEIGWILNKKYWNCGYVSEAALAVLDFAKNYLYFQKVIAQCDWRNGASAKVMEKIGMRLVDDKGMRTYLKREESARINILHRILNIVFQIVAQTGTVIFAFTTPVLLIADSIKKVLGSEFWLAPQTGYWH